MGSFSDFLYPQSGAVEGAARILDFTDSLTRYNRSQTPAEADDLALRADVAAVGEDMGRALVCVEEQAKPTEPPAKSAG
jgi:hypothetical protein